MSDRELVERIRDGDDRAFEQLFRAHYESLVLFTVRYVGDRPRAEDVVQSLFADLWANRAAWEVRSSVRAYLFSAVRNRALNVRRRSMIERDWDDGEARADAEAMTWGAPPELPDAQVEKAEDVDRLRAAVSTLPERCRLTMQLRWRDQLSYAEIAETLGISIKGVENQLARGLKALREKLL